MSRVEKVIDIQDRDQKLTFVVREMPAMHLERWLSRAVIVLAGSGVRPARGADVYAAGSFILEHLFTGLGNLDYDKAAPLLDEMLACCSRVVEKVEERCTPSSLEGYVRDVRTIARLRWEALKINLGFLLPESAGLSGSPEGGSTGPQ